MRLEHAREEFLKSFQLDKNALCCFLVTSEDFISYVGNMPIDQLSAQNLREYMVYRPTLLGYASLLLWLRWCEWHGLAEVYPPEEISALYNYLHDRPFGGRFLIPGSSLWE